MYSLTVLPLSARLEAPPPADIAGCFPSSVTRSFHQSMTQLSNDLMERASLMALGDAPAEARQYLATALALRLAKRIAYKVTGRIDTAVVDDVQMTDDVRVNAEVRRQAYLEVARRTLDSMPGTEVEEKKSAFLERVLDLEVSLPPFMNDSVHRGILFSNEYDRHCDLHEIANLASTSARRMTVIGESISAKDFAPILEKSLKTVYKNLFSSQSEWKWTSLFSLGREDEPVLSPTEMLGYTADEVLDGISVARDSLRDSSHRSALYNLQTFRINYVKLMLLRQEHAGRMKGWDRGEVRRDLHDKILSPGQQRALRLLMRTHIARDLGPDHMKHVRSPLEPRSLNRLVVYARMGTGPAAKYRSSRRISRIFDNGEEVQTFVNNMMIRFIAANVTLIPSSALRSPESADVMGGAWQMRAVNLATAQEVPAMIFAPQEIGVKLIAACMKLLILKTKLGTPKVLLTEPLAVVTVVNATAASNFGLCGVEFREQSQIVAADEQVVFWPYPGEKDAEEGVHYTIWSIHRTAVEALKSYAKLSASGEMVADIIEANDGYVVAGAYQHLPDPSLSSSSASGGDSTAVSRESVVQDADARMVVSGTLVEVSSRRTAEAGFRPSAPVAHDVNPSSALRVDAGIGMASESSFGLRPLTGEAALVEASRLANVVSTQDQLIWAAALATASLREPSGADPDQVYQSAMAVLAEWDLVTTSYPFEGINYAALGVRASMDAIITWLRFQRYTYAIGEASREDLTCVPVIPQSLFMGVGSSIYATPANATRMSLSDIRIHVANGTPFHSIMPEVGARMDMRPLAFATGPRSGNNSPDRSIGDIHEDDLETIHSGLSSMESEYSF